MECGRDVVGKGFFAGEDKENLEGFGAAATAKHILAKYFHQGARSRAEQGAVTFWKHGVPEER